MPGRQGARGRRSEIPLRQHYRVWLAGGVMARHMITTPAPAAGREGGGRGGAARWGAGDTTVSGTACTAV